LDNGNVVKDHSHIVAENDKGLYQRNAIYGADNGGGKPKEGNGASTVDGDGGLILNRIPLHR
jgi:hypothetical protein